MTAWWISPRSAARFLAQFVRAVGPDHPLVGSYVGGALALGFGGRPCTSPDALGDAGRALVRDVSQFDAGGDRIASSFATLGLPTTAEARRAWLDR